MLDIIGNEGYLADSNSSDITEPPCIVQFGGQTAVNLATPLTRDGLPIIGSSSETIDLAEDRKRFERFLSELGIPQSPGAAVTTVEEAITVAELIGYPVLVRPSYVLGGRAMEIVHNINELARFVKQAADLDTGHPILIDKYLLGKECEIDAIGDGESFYPRCHGTYRASRSTQRRFDGCYPAIKLTKTEIDTIVDYSVRIGLALGIKGL